jgi:hypothetical protein
MRRPRRVYLECDTKGNSGSAEEDQWPVDANGGRGGASLGGGSGSSGGRPRIGLRLARRGGGHTSGGRGDAL